MSESHHNRAASLAWDRLPWLIVLSLLTFSLVGCRGCFTGTNSSAKTKQGDKKKKESEKDKEFKSRITTKDLQQLPATAGDNVIFAKPGHWVQAKQEAKANEGNETMELVTEITERKLGRTIPLRGTGNYMRFTRDVTIAKGQSKSSDIFYFHPDMPTDLDEDKMPIRSSVRLSYLQKGLGVSLWEPPSSPENIARPEQYSLVVLGKDTKPHQRWTGLSCMSWPSEFAEEREKISPHRVTLIKEENINNLLPDRFFAWSTISHVVWYDIDGTQCSDAQQQALVDWLHWGGTLILSGPDALGGLSDSFLAQYLPLEKLEIKSLTPEICEPFSQKWTVPGEESSQILLPPDRSVTLLEGTLRPGCQWVNGADGIVAERSVGRGRVVMSCLPLSDDLLGRWKSYSSFVNGALLGHPPREWVTSKGPIPGKELRFAGRLRGKEGRSHLSTDFRIVSRDMQSDIAGINAKEVDDAAANNTSGQSVWLPDKQNDEAVLATTRSTASWNDATPVSAGATSSLTAASGIRVPRVSVIIKLLAGYLLFLVPVNWVVFRLIGRVEWAWIAAPVIALIGAIVVGRIVQLDIGFSRSENRINVVEAYLDYPRAHQTTYASLYTSLSTFYKATFEQETGVVLPLASGITSNTRRKDRQDLTYRYSQDGGNGLYDFSVLSNSTGMLHAEEMLVLDGTYKGGVDWNTGEVQLINGTPTLVQGLAVVGRNLEGKLVHGWVGDLPKQGSRKVALKEWETAERWCNEWDSIETTQRNSTLLQSDGSLQIRNDRNSLAVGDVLAAILKDRDFQAGELMALGFMEAQLGSLEILPKASQQNRQSALVIHISNGSRKALPDKSLPEKSKVDDDEIDEDLSKLKSP